MKLFLQSNWKYLGLLLFAFVIALGMARAERSHLPMIPACTVVAVSMVSDVDSGKAQPGDFFRFRTINAVTVGNQIVIPARTLGYGVVAVVSAAGRGGRAGVLVLEPRYLRLLDSSQLGVVLDHNAGDLQRSGTSNSLPGYLGAVPIPALGAAIGAFNYFHNGKNIEVKPGTIFAIFPSDDPAVARCQIHS